ncbi:MlaC/ttg2D family ABC transporter substrate-binding protein [Tanticharoenia sakaeratensis]|uniref:Toluene tolerance family protein n=1 Tax=Tanticharoenia sakaeratensis NBRC 103193 TaxID=1231623 RepID=A0A0D6MPN4_9PROT|nr:toluene tolerance family protein [Tanticharoenia sakaeratensis NBRC 103193]
MPLSPPRPRRSLTRRSGMACIAAALSALIAISLPFGSARAATEAEARNFIDSFGGKLVAIVNSDQSLDAKKQAVLPLLQQNVDVSLIGRFCLGRYWRNATPEQQQRYLDLFDHVLVNAITDKLGDYRGVHLTVTSAAPSGTGEMVNATLTRPGQPPAEMQLLVEDSSGAPKVADMIGEGASLRLTQRQDYASYLARNGGNVDTLIAALQRQLARHH